MTKLTKDAQTPIKPSDINTLRHFYNSVWQRNETEISARAIVSFCQTRKDGASWEPFKKADLDKHWEENVWFNGLDNEQAPYIYVEDGEITLTIEFVAACYACSPKDRQKT